MDDVSQTPKPVQSKSPTELLSDQTHSLSELVQIQKIQSNQIGELQQQNKRVLELLENVSDEDPGTGRVYVKIEDFNMPFGALVGILIKISLAAIPAAIILAVIYGLVVLAFGGILGGIVSGLR